MTEALAARTAYAIGLHRTEVNASFGEATHRTRSVDPLIRAPWPHDRLGNQLVLKAVEL